MSYAKQLEAHSPRESNARERIMEANQMLSTLVSEILAFNDRALGPQPVPNAGGTLTVGPRSLHEELNETFSNIGRLREQIQALGSIA